MFISPRGAHLSANAQGFCPCLCISIPFRFQRCLLSCSLFVLARYASLNFSDFINCYFLFGSAEGLTVCTYNTFLTRNPAYGFLEKERKKNFLRRLNLYVRCSFESWYRGTSLVVQWLRTRLPMQGTQVRALVWRDSTCCGATKPVRHNY